MYYACCKEPYPDVSFKFRIQRDSPAYRAIIVLPCLGKYMLRFIKSDFKILKDMIFQIRLYLLWITHPTRYLVGCIIQKGLLYIRTFFSVIMLMTGCSFLLSPAAGEKILINCIAILSAILYLLYFAITLPFKRTEVPIIGNTILKNLRKKILKILMMFLYFLQSLFIAILQH